MHFDAAMRFLRSLRWAPTSLYELLGRVVGSQAGFDHSPALEGANFAWTDDNLQRFLLAPAAFLPGKKMHFNGLKREGELADLMAYLKAASGKRP